MDNSCNIFTLYFQENLINKNKESSSWSYLIYWTMVGTPPLSSCYIHWQQIAFFRLCKTKMASVQALWLHTIWKNITSPYKSKCVLHIQQDRVTTVVFTLLLLPCQPSRISTSLFPLIIHLSNEKGRKRHPLLSKKNKF